MAHPNNFRLLVSVTLLVVSGIFQSTTAVPIMQILHRNTSSANHSVQSDGLTYTTAASIVHQGDRNRNTPTQSTSLGAEPWSYPSTEPSYNKMSSTNLPTPNSEYSAQFIIGETWIPANSAEPIPRTFVQPPLSILPLLQEQNFVMSVPSPEASASPTVEPSGMEYPTIGPLTASSDLSTQFEGEGTSKPGSSSEPSLLESFQALLSAWIFGHDDKLVLLAPSLEPSLPLSSDPSYIDYLIVGTPSTSFESFAQLDHDGKNIPTPSVDTKPMFSIQVSPDFTNGVADGQLLTKTPSTEPSMQTDTDNWLIGLNSPDPGDDPTIRSPEPSRQPISDSLVSPSDFLQAVLNPDATKHVNFYY